MLRKYSPLLFPLIFFTTSSFSQESFDEQCNNVVNSEAVAFWDFNRKSDKSFPLENGIVKFNNRHSGVVPIPDTEMSGIRFHFKGKWPDGDSTSEWRYKIVEPQDHIFEYMKVYQPKNFYHRLIIEITTDSEILPENWRFGDKVTSDNGHSATVAKAFKNKLFIEAPDIIYKKAWGNNRKITNISNESSFISQDSKYMGSNNKLSVMWQGKYSNASMVVGTTAVAKKSGGIPGNAYCEALLGKSHDHSTFGTQSNFVSQTKLKYPLCFDTNDNGSIVEFVIERKRSTSITEPNGIYSIWRRTSEIPWQNIYFNNKIKAFQHEKNYLDSGYIFGWSNSGFKDDTDFYLLSWGLWTERPHFL